ncbi:MAG: D-glycero-beta-D-manno-heptose 1-phosphate adenylyltransferase [Candidatus Omnitrophica bacterium CG_4_9_14_0_2_um_filter_42_8]|nr:MAG: D-glycero-beta-D-manno-heptose 1-phosphate adenylyltransferase [Candidatus Omnitrophica bacterium CG22_combo_CG10-13_8_21_14_all_43_16]PJC49057.1 MAG: D-glycero-beta-D-manno-heptose 1-phosphate adenylyltransferase [Candidatus Omnitrophica bacterium CG_4_9_14_0_2_um_filter_42_8]
MLSNKIKTLPQIAGAIKKLKQKNKKIVFTNGCFDILHAGHVNYLAKAKSLGDTLVIGLNSDGSVKKLKGKSRPVIAQKNRAILLAALEAVDIVVVFNDMTPLKLIKLVKPDVLVKGGDWKKEDIVGSDFVESYGGKVKSLVYIKGFSTRNIISKIQNN